MLETILAVLMPVIEALAAKYGIVVQVLTVIGLVRLCMKPIMVALEEVIKITPSTKDDEMVAKLLANPIYKAVVFCFDWLLSIRLPRAAK